eukprot:4321914-Prymnesium_polylepis.1
MGAMTRSVTIRMTQSTISSAGFVSARSTMVSVERSPSVCSMISPPHRTHAGNSASRCGRLFPRAYRMPDNSGAPTMKPTVVRTRMVACALSAAITSSNSSKSRSPLPS